MGMVCPLGSSRGELWTALSTGQSGIRPLESLPGQQLSTMVAGEALQFRGEIDDFGPLDKALKRTIKKSLKLMCREIEMGVAAAQLALLDAGLKLGEYDPDRAGVVCGSDYMMTDPNEFTSGVRKCLDAEGGFHFEEWAKHGLPEVAPLWLLKYLPNMPSSHIAIYNDLRGPNNSITLREASANLACAEAFTTLQRGAADIMLAGATGTRVHPLRSIHVVMQEQIAPGDGDPAKACRPFDKDRNGLVLGEGSAAIIMETLESAQARNATILGEVAGYGSSTVVDKDGKSNYRQALVNVMRQGLRSSGLKPEEVGHVHAHGLSTTECDIEESKAINEVFGQRDKPVPVTAAKSYMGNLGAGSGMVEMIGSVEAIHKNHLFPTLNYETPDPECDIAVVSEQGADPGDSFININVTPQGQASAIVVRRFSE